MLLLLMVCETSRIWTAGQNHIAQYPEAQTDNRSEHERLLADSLNFIPLESSFRQIGKASYYANKFHGRRTASGECFDMDGFTAAHRKLAFGTIVRVVNPENNTAIVVQVNDRGPFVRSRVIDMARGAARCIDVSLHKVSVEAFSADSEDSTHYDLAFRGTNYDAYKVASSSLVVSDTFECFSDAVRKHRILAAKNPDQDVFLVIAKPSTSADHSTSAVSDSKTRYLVATRNDKRDIFNTTSLLTE